MTNKGALYKKMSDVMSELGGIKKDKKHPKHGYEYASSEAVKDAVRRAMAKHGLALMFHIVSQDVVKFKSRGGADGIEVTAHIAFTIADGETGECETRIVVNMARDYDDKVYNKLYTTAEKYFLLTTFLIGTGVDDDADGADTPIPAPTPELMMPEPHNKYGTPETFFERVQQKTGGYYTGTDHLLATIGGEWPDWNNKDAVKAAGTLAIDVAKNADEGAE